MKIKNDVVLHDFLAAIDRCKGDVYLISPFGDRYNLKSELSKYVAIGALLAKDGDNLELFCEHKEDEGYLLDFFNHNPEVF